MRRSVLMLSAGLAVLMTGWASPATAEKIDRRFHQTFEVEEGARLVLHHGDGDVVITPWDENSIDVEVVYRASVRLARSGQSDEFDVEFDQRGNTVSVIGKEPSVTITRGFSYSIEREHTYTVKAPPWVALELKGEDGDVAIERWVGDIELELEDGDVELTAISSSSTRLELEDGDLEIDGLQGEFQIRGEDGDMQVRDCETTAGSIQTGDGDVTVERCAGNIELASSDGRLRLSEIRGQRLGIRTSDGDVELDLLANEELDLTIRSGDGNVRVGLPPGLSLDFSIQTQDGDVRMSGIEVADLRKNKRHTSGRIGEGRGSMQIITGDGDVTLRQD